MFTTAWLALALGQSTTLTLQPNPLLTPPSWGDGTTVGSPAVFVHDPYDVGGNIRVLFMLYETRIEAASAACPAGKWGIGVAFRVFGSETDSLVDLGAVVEPEDGTFYSCVAAHPTVVEFSDLPYVGGQTWGLFFKAEQDCTGQGPSCERYSGVGRVVISYRSTSLFIPRYTVSDPDDNPVLTDVAQNMGYPKVAYVDGAYRMSYGEYPDIRMAHSPMTDNWTVLPSPVVEAGDPDGWGDDELLSASLLCDSDSEMWMYPIGRSWTSSPSMLDDVSIGRFESTDTAGQFASWSESSLSPLSFDSANVPEMRHAQVVSTSDDEFAVYFSTPSGSGNEIRFAMSSNYFWKNIVDWRCP